MKVTTVLGEVDGSELGVVLPHEHLIALASNQWRMPTDPAELRDAVQPVTLERRGRAQLEPFRYRSVMQHIDVATTVAELEPFVAAGGGTVVDLSVPGFGRDPVALQAISILSGVHVVMGCGEYVEHSHSPYVRGATEAQVVDVLLRDLTEGVGTTGIRAGIIGEIGVGNPVTGDERKVLRASARAQLETGVALNIHRTVYPDPMAALVALDEVLALGVAPDRVVVSHCDERPEPELARAVAERGAWVELDTFGMEQWAANWDQGGQVVQRSFDHHRVELLLGLLAEGHLDRLLLSQDVAMTNQLTRNGGWGYNHLTANVEPRLRAVGLSADELHQLRVANPRRMLAGA
jgi:phosphotriesterase-related protein